MSIEILAIDGRAYTKLDIIEYEISPEVLDGEGTGRTKAPGWEMIRDPQGLLTNLYIEVGETSSDNEDFLHLYGVGKRMGKEDFVPAVFLDLDGTIISQQVYIKIQRVRVTKFENNGKIYVGSMKVSIIAKKGVV